MDILHVQRIHLTSMDLSLHWMSFWKLLNLQQHWRTVYQQLTS